MKRTLLHGTLETSKGIEAKLAQTVEGNNFKHRTKIVIIV